MKQDLPERAMKRGREAGVRQDEGRDGDGGRATKRARRKEPEAGGAAMDSGDAVASHRTDIDGEDGE